MVIIRSDDHDDPMTVMKTARKDDRVKSHRERQLDSIMLVTL